MISEDARRELAKISAMAVEQYPDSWIGRVQTITISIIGLTLGFDWYAENIENGKSSFLRDKPEGPANLAYERIVRRMFLAEYLINLCNLDGAMAIAEALKDDPEARFAEFEAAHLLTSAGVPFKFNRPGTGKGQDFDLQLSIQGRFAAGEVKSRNEENPLSEKAVRERLNSARKQLPSDQPGIIFYKMPYIWYELGHMEDMVSVRKTASDYLFRTSQRVVAVIFYTRLVAIDEYSNRSVIKADQYLSTRHRFDTSVDWSVIRTNDVRAKNDWVTVPSLAG